MKEMYEHVEKQARFPFHKKMSSLDGALRYTRIALETYCNAKATIETIDEGVWKFLITVDEVKESKKEEELPPWASNETIDPVEQAQIELQCAVEHEDAKGIADFGGRIEMSETQEHKDNTEEKGRFHGSLFSETYRKDRAAYLSIVESKFQDIVKVQELINQYGDKKLSELLLDVEERYNMAKEMVDTFCKEEDEALRALEKKYTPGELVALTCNARDTVDLAMKFVKGEI